MVDEDLLIRYDLLGWPVEAGHATSSVDVAIVGGGITGLGAAHALRAGDPTLRITVFEGAPAVGGKLRTIDFAGQRIAPDHEAVGPGVDALARKVDGAELAPHRRGSLEHGNAQGGVAGAQGVGGAQPG